MDTYNWFQAVQEGVCNVLHDEFFECWSHLLVDGQHFRLVAETFPSFAPEEEKMEVKELCDFYLSGSLCI